MDTEGHESWIVRVFLDFLDDDYCFETLYRFRSLSLAEEFVQCAEKESLSCLLICRDITYEKSRSIQGYTADHPPRPIYDDVAEALEDLQDFVKNPRTCKNADSIFSNTSLSDRSKVGCAQYITDLEKKIRLLEEEILCRNEKIDHLKEQLLLLEKESRQLSA
jgi:hypothetical protein